jgi:hypothetical protein
MDQLQRIWRALGSPSILMMAVGLACFILVLFFVGLSVLSSGGESGTVQPANTIIPGPTSTVYSPTATATRVPTATSNLPAAPLPGMIGVGVSVQITGTEGSGLNIRSQPGLGTDIRFVALDSEIFEVRDGPQVVDEITWWLLVTPLDENRSGWAAANYLSLVVPEE